MNNNVEQSKQDKQVLESTKKLLKCEGKVSALQSALSAKQELDLAHARFNI